MSTLISGSIDLTKIDKEKLVNGKYLNIQISINDNSDQYGNNVGITIGQSKEEREAKAKKTYIGNAKVVWTDGSIKVAEKVQESAPIQAKDDLPF
jgi:hypothetical protein